MLLCMLKKNTRVFIVLEHLNKKLAFSSSSDQESVFKVSEIKSSIVVTVFLWMVTVEKRCVFKFPHRLIQDVSEKF